jgi:hypothetical protein
MRVTDSLKAFPNFKGASQNFDFDFFNNEVTKNCKNSSAYTEIPIKNHRPSTKNIHIVTYSQLKGTVICLPC